MHTRESVIRDLKNLSIRLGTESLSKNDVDADSNTPSSMTYIRMFGSWATAMTAAGLHSGKGGRPRKDSIISSSSDKPNLMLRKKPWPVDDPLEFPETGLVSNDPERIHMDEHLIWDGHRLDPKFLRSVNEDVRDEIAKDVLNFLLRCNIMSIGYDHKKVLRDFENLKKSKKKVEEHDGKLILANQGASGHKIYRHFFPNILKVGSGGRPSIYTVLSDKRTLWSVIRNRMGNTLLYSDDGGKPRQYPMPITLSQIAIGAKNSGLASMGSVFKPDVARAVYLRCIRDGMRVLDYSCGFGTRLLGLMASGIKASYMGYEPNTETYTGIEKMRDFFGFKNVDVRCCGSEDGEMFENIDFAFSSPPYFSFEKYCDEPTQCYLKFPEYEQWLEKYWRATVSRIREMLVQDGIFGVNIGNTANRMMKGLEKDTRKIVEDEGFVFEETIWMSTSRSHLTNKKNSGNINKMEGIFFYRKDSNMCKTFSKLGFRETPTVVVEPIHEPQISKSAAVADIMIECGDMLEKVPSMKERPILVIMSPPDLSEFKDDLMAYESFLCTAYSTVVETVAPGGVIVSSTTDRRSGGKIYPKHVKIMETVFNHGMILEDYKIWAKTLKTNLFIPTFTHVMIFRKQGNGIRNKVQEFLPDVWHLELDKIRGYPSHDAFPSELVRRIILKYSNEGDLILDPFIGSGKTAFVCKNLGRRCIGFDTDPGAISSLSSRL